MGLRLANEFALNARSHPLAAAIASARFEPALRRLARRQACCFRLIERSNATGLVEPIRFRECGIAPSFFRLTAAWRKRPENEALRDALGGALLTPVPVQVLYRQAAFLAQYATGRPRRCPEAERQAGRRFCIGIDRPQLTAAR